MKCKHCKRNILVDMEDDLIHSHLEEEGVDSRMCEPNNPDSTIAEEISMLSKENDDSN